MRKKRYAWNVALAWVGSAAAVAAAVPESVATDGFSRYRVILERRPFGEAPIPESAPAPVVETAPPEWVASYRLCSIYESSAGVGQAALVDTKTSKPIMLTVGAPGEEGIELIAVDLSEESVRVARGDVSFTLRLKDSGRPRTPAANLAALASAAQPPPPPPRPPPGPPTEEQQEQLRQVARALRPRPQPRPASEPAPLSAFALAAQRYRERMEQQASGR